MYNMLPSQYLQKATMFDEVITSIAEHEQAEQSISESDKF